VISLSLFGRGQLGLNELVWLIVFVSKLGLTRPPYAPGPSSQKTEGASVFLGLDLRQLERLFPSLSAPSPNFDQWTKLGHLRL